MGRLILGIGPGRCGTASLAEILGRQPSTAAWHCCPVFPRGENPPRTIQELRARSCGARVAAAVGPLWLMQAERAMADPDGGWTQVLVTWRTPEQIAASMEATGYWKRLAGLEALAAPGRDAREYIANYYLACWQLAARWPARIRAVDCDGLGDPSYIADLLSWCGFAERDATPAHANRRGTESEDRSRSNPAGQDLLAAG